MGTAALAIAARFVAPARVKDTPDPACDLDLAQLKQPRTRYLARPTPCDRISNFASAAIAALATLASRGPCPRVTFVIAARQGPYLDAAGLSRSPIDLISFFDSNPAEREAHMLGWFQALMPRHCAVCCWEAKRSSITADRSSTARSKPTISHVRS